MVRTAAMAPRKEAEMGKGDVASPASPAMKPTNSMRGKRHAKWSQAEIP